MKHFKNLLIARQYTIMITRIGLHNILLTVWFQMEEYIYFIQNMKLLHGSGLICNRHWQYPFCEYIWGEMVAVHCLLPLFTKILLWMIIIMLGLILGFIVQYFLPYFKNSMGHFLKKYYRLCVSKIFYAKIFLHNMFGYFVWKKKFLRQLRELQSSIDTIEYNSKTFF